MAVHHEDSFITMDMGGTSFDAALVKHGVPSITTHASVERMALALPTMEIVTIGAGGGSVGWIDDGGLLRMARKAPEPSQALFVMGSAATCRPAATRILVLGYLNAEFFAGGRIKLNPDAARYAISEKIGRPLVLDPVAAAAGMYRIMNVSMASAIREISVQKGYDAREFDRRLRWRSGPDPRVHDRARTRHSADFDPA